MFVRSSLQLGLMFCALTALNAFAYADSDAETVVRSRSIGYVATGLHWALYQSADGKAECPRGTAPNGPREIFKSLYPNLGSVEKTQLARESLRVFPRDLPAQFEYYEATGNISLGLNLDGKTGSRDFTSPLGEKGIDNAFYRVIGCNAEFRGPDGFFHIFANKGVPFSGFNRTLLEITDVDSLVNDDDVNINIYRGRDPLVLDATGEKVAPGGTQRIDMKYGQRLVQHLHGRITDGVLTTDAKDGEWSWTPHILKFHDMRLSLKLSPDGADGMIGGYADNEELFKWIKGYSTHHLSYGQLDAPEFYWEIRKNADAYPDEDGAMTAISSAIVANFAQVFIEHAPDNVAILDSGVNQQKILQGSRR